MRFALCALRYALCAMRHALTIYHSVFSYLLLQWYLDISLFPFFQQSYQTVR